MRARAGATVEDCADPEEWDAFVRRVDGPPFARWGWGAAVDAYGHDRWNLVARRGGDVVGALPLVHIRSRLFGSKLVSPPFGERGGTLVAESAGPEVAERLLERAADIADERRVDFVSLRGVETNPVGEFESRERFVTFRVPVDGSVESVREAIKSSRERQIRQAADNPDLTYEVGDSIDDLRAYYRLYLASVRGHGTPAHSFEFYRRLWEHLAPDDALRLSLVRKDGDLINGMIDLACGSTVHQWGVVTDYEHRDLNGGSYLLWKSLERACEDGFDAYELGRTREGSGVYTFKKSFGGAKHWYRDLHYFPAGEADLPDPEDESYEPLKRVWRRLPIPVTRRLGPVFRSKISL